MILYSVRHGESVYNAEGRVQGQSDVPLSDFGRRQSESRRTLARRGCKALSAIRHAGHEHAAVVSHGWLLVVTLEALAAFPEGQTLESLHNGSITRLRLDADGQARLLSLNQVDHLKDVGTGGHGDL